MEYNKWVWYPKSPFTFCNLCKLLVWLLFFYFNNNLCYSYTIFCHWEHGLSPTARWSLSFLMSLYYQCVCVYLRKSFMPIFTSEFNNTGSHFPFVFRCKAGSKVRNTTYDIWTTETRERPISALNKQSQTPWTMATEQSSRKSGQRFYLTIINFKDTYPFLICLLQMVVQFHKCITMLWENSNQVQIMLKQLFLKTKVVKVLCNPVNVR